MKLIIAGSRTITNYALLLEAIDMIPRGEIFTEIVSGGAAGVDRLGELFARRHKIPLTIMEADWESFGKRAGILRNDEMARYADALLALWDGKSRGTADMIRRMDKLGKPTYVRTTE